MSEYHTVRGKSVTWHGAIAEVLGSGAVALSVGDHRGLDVTEADALALYQVLGDVVEWGDGSAGTEGAAGRELKAAEAQEGPP